MGNSTIPQLIECLQSAENFSHPVSQFSVIETHLSWLLLTGEYVYKFKKPVDLGFADFTSLELRKKYCLAELRLNRRLAADYYLRVLPVTGSVQQPKLGGDGPVIEYCLQMRQFAQQDRLDHLLENHRVDRQMMYRFAEAVAEFHGSLQGADATAAFGEAEQVNQAVMNVFHSIEKASDDEKILAEAETIRIWCEKEYRLIQPLLRQRKQDGFIREGHGDMHLANLAWVDQHPLIFDCLEFNAQLRWNDVISEVAFLYMDLLDHRRGDLAQAFINHYLEKTGDYPGIRTLPYYLVYRSMVRAMVAVIRLSQSLTADERQQAESEYAMYVQLAEHCIADRQPVLIITHGLSGSGKTSWSRVLAETIQAFHLRSDVERKRLFAEPAQEQKQRVNQGIYRHEITRQTYARLLHLAEGILQAGYPVIVDATFIDRQQRELFYQLADKMQLNYHLLDFIASEAELRQRVINRQGDASDADIRVLEQQLATASEPGEDETPHLIRVDTMGRMDMHDVASQITGRN